MLDWLKTILGDSYTEEIDKKVAEAIGKDFVARKDFNEVNEAKKGLEKTIKERDDQLEELKKVDTEGLQAKIDELQEDNKKAQTDYEAEIEKVKLNGALENRLIKDGAVSTKAVKALLDVSKISLDGDNLIGYDEQIKPIKESEKWAFQTSTPGKTGIEQKPGGGAGEKTFADEIQAEVFGKKG